MFWYTVMETMQVEPRFIHFGLWAATLFSVVAAILFAFIAALMAIVNTATVPIHTITGRSGLYAWNTISGML